MNTHPIFDELGIGTISIKEICDMINEYTNKNISYVKYDKIYYDIFINGLLYLIGENII